MAYTFNSFRMAKINREFDPKSAMGVMDAVLDDMLTDEEKIKASDDVTNLVEAHAEQFASAMADGSIKTEELAERMATTIEYNSKNIQSVLNSAMKIEKTAENGRHGHLGNTGP